MRDSQARSRPDEVRESLSSPRCPGDGTACPCSTPPRSTHLEHKPDEDAEHQAEADVCMVVDDELLAEERVTFRPPTESHGSGRALLAGARTLARSAAAAKTSPARPGPPASPAAQRGTTSGPAPFLRPPRPRPAARNRPWPQPAPRRGRTGADLWPRPLPSTAPPPGRKGARSNHAPVLRPSRPQTPAASAADHAP